MHDYHLHKTFMKGQALEWSRKAKMDALADEARRAARDEQQPRIVKTVTRRATSPLRIVAVIVQQVQQRALSRKETLEYLGRTSESPTPRTQS